MMQDIQQTIVDNIANYSKNQKKLANYILENLQTVPLLSVSELARNADVSTATIVRFTRVLGYDGYLQFRNQLLKILKEQLSPLERYKQTLSKKDDYQDLLQKVSQNVVENIQHSLDQNNPDEFHKIVDLIRKADNIFCLGIGISHFLADILAYLLKLYMKKAFSVSNDAPSYHEQIILLNPKDLLIVFSYPPYSRPTIEVAKQAKDMQIPVVAFTDKRTAPVNEFAKHTLIAKTDNILFTNSMGAISVFMNALITELALTEERKVMDGLEKVESYLNDKRYFY